MANRSGMAAVYGALTLDVTRDITLNDVVVEVDAWSEGSAHVDFPYQATIPVTGANDKMKVEVVFSALDAATGNYAPIAESIEGGVKIFAINVPEYAITIPTIILWK